MQRVDCILFEPVGCLAEFPRDEFNEIALKLFGHENPANRSGSEAYWNVLDWMQKMDKEFGPSDKELVEGLEIQAIDRVELYEDVGPSLSELNGMGIESLIASSLSEGAVNHFIERFALADAFRAVWTRDNAGGVKTVPLARAIADSAFEPENVISLADTEEGLKAATDVGANSILMINDYDEGRRLAMHGPTGGIVSLHELPDFVRLVAENTGVSSQT